MVEKSRKEREDGNPFLFGRTGITSATGREKRWVLPGAMTGQAMEKM